MTVKNLKIWLASLPPEFDQADVESVFHAMPSAAKRVIAYRYKEGGSMGVAVNSMGTHYSDEWAAEVDFVSILSSDGTHHIPEAKPTTPQ